MKLQQQRLPGRQLGRRLPAAGVQAANAAFLGAVKNNEFGYGTMGVSLTLEEGPDILMELGRERRELVGVRRRGALPTMHLDEVGPRRPADRRD